MQRLNLDTLWTYQLTVLADRVTRHTGALAARHGLTVAHWRVLAAIADKPGRSARDVQDITPMDKSSISRAVTVLVDEGYVDRRASEADGRLTHLHLTPAGSDIYDDIAQAVAAHADRLLRCLGTRDQQFAAAIQVLAKTAHLTTADDIA